MINDFDSLSSAIANWLARADLAAVIPSLIQLAEIRIFNDPDDALRVRQMHTTVSDTAADGVIRIPDDFLQIHSLEIGRRELFPDTGYTVVGNEIRLQCAGEDYELIYYARPPSLESAGQNWLILAAPNVYLYGALLEASPYLKNDARIAVWGAGFKEAMRGLKVADDRARFGPGLRMRPAHAP